MVPSATSEPISRTQSVTSITITPSSTTTDLISSLTILETTTIMKTTTAITLIEFSSIVPTTTTTNPITTTRDKNCDENLCEHNSTCVSLINIRDKFYLKRSYLCECPIGFSGSLCEKDLRPCSNYVCINNSTCEYLNNNNVEFKCNCQPGFEGLFCETNTACHNVTCLNNGNCIDGINNNYTCLCPMYYSGTFCETKDEDLTVLENVSASISVAGIVSLGSWILFILLLDASRYIFQIEPQSLLKHRKLLKKEKICIRIKTRIRKLLIRYKKLEMEDLNMFQNKNQLNTNIKRIFSHFSVKNVKYIDEDSIHEKSVDNFKLINSKSFHSTNMVDIKELN